jgi:hypothetical protein
MYSMRSQSDLDPRDYFTLMVGDPKTPPMLFDEKPL